MYEWSWAFGIFEDLGGKSPDQFTPEDVINIIKEWKNSVLAIDEKLYADAQKEFRLNKQIGFGIDGDIDVKEQDFNAVRGKFEEHPMVVEINHHIERKTRLGDEMINMISNIKD